MRSSIIQLRTGSFAGLLALILLSVSLCACSEIQTVTPPDAGSNDSADADTSGDDDADTSGDDDADTSGDDDTNTGGDDTGTFDCAITTCPPIAPSCDGNTLITFATPSLDSNTCACDYANLTRQEQPCADTELCDAEAGACRDKCSDVICPLDDASLCTEDNTLLLFPTTCNPLTGACELIDAGRITSACFDGSEVCTGGGCQSPTCLSDADCLIPAPRCSGDFVVSFVGTPDCDSGVSTCRGLTASVTDCAQTGQTCNNGACVADCPLSCPASYCDESGASVVSYSAPGTCTLDDEMTPSCAYDGAMSTVECADPELCVFDEQTQTAACQP